MKQISSFPASGIQYIPKGATILGIRMQYGSPALIVEHSQNVESEPRNFYTLPEFSAFPDDHVVIGLYSQQYVGSEYPMHNVLLEAPRV